MYTKPILYLGRDRVDKSYYFLGSKEEVGRFIKFTSYPYWCKSDMVGNFLDLGSEVPVEILEEIMLFVNGVIDYELLPKSRGRSETVVRLDTRTGTKTKFKTSVKTEVEESGPVPVPKSVPVKPSVSVPTQPLRGRGSETEIPATTVSTPLDENLLKQPGTSASPDGLGQEPVKRKRVRRTRLQIEEDNRAAEALRRASLDGDGGAGIVAVTKPVRGSSEAPEELIDSQPVPVVRKRGRPKKVLGGTGNILLGSSL